MTPDKKLHATENFIQIYQFMDTTIIHTDGDAHIHVTSNITESTFLA